MPFYRRAVSIHINCDGAAFEKDATAEVIRMLRAAIDHIGDVRVVTDSADAVLAVNDRRILLYDHNGNRAGVLHVHS
jgi:hypothetical protein